MSLGSVLKATRQAQHKSQKQLAAGICSQAMLSAIENDRYTPNVKLVLALCQRLKINLASFKLVTNFGISHQTTFNETVNDLCNQHLYSKLKTFLRQPQTLQAIETDDQTQAYYYYLGVAEFQTEKNLTAAYQNLSLAVNLIAPRQQLSTLSRLALVSLALMIGRNQQPTKVVPLIKRALIEINEAPYEANLNAVYYLTALIYFDLGKYQFAVDYLKQDIAFATHHDSHYLLANDYRLLAEIAAVTGQKQQELVATAQEQFLVSLFHEKINEVF